MPPLTIIKLSNVNVRSARKLLFNDLNFEVKLGEHWALIGAGGTGKTALLETLAGNFNVTGGHIERPFYDNYVKSHTPEDPFFNHTHLVSYLPVKYQFRNLSNISEFFYQQRFNAAFSEDAPTVANYLKETSESCTVTGQWTEESVKDLFQLGPVFDKQLIKLSNGETKRLRLAAALLRNPKLMLLDNPLVGLDVQTRATFDEILSTIAASGVTIVLSTTVGEIPSVVTHAALLHDGKIIKTVSRLEFGTLSVATSTLKPISTAKLSALVPKTHPPVFENIVKMTDVTVRYGDALILDSVSWVVRAGERWALRGPNGAGKSTLLSLINGDNPQAYANDIVLFDRKRGTGESIWDIKKKIGFVSPELLQCFHSTATCRQIVATGFHDTIGYLNPVTTDQEHIVDQWVKILELNESADEPFETASPAIQRLVLLARALVKNPPLLVLDEPCQGLDSSQQLRVQSVLDAVCMESPTALIYVTHYQEELPACINHLLELENGRVV